MHIPGSRNHIDHAKPSHFKPVNSFRMLAAAEHSFSDLARSRLARTRPASGPAPAGSGRLRLHLQAPGAPRPWGNHD